METGYQMSYIFLITSFFVGNKMTISDKEC